MARELRLSDREKWRNRSKEEARRLLEQYENKGDARDFNEYYELRQVCPDDAEEATGIEAICFLPSEACTLPIMKERIQYAARSFLVAMDRRDREDGWFHKCPLHG